MKKTRTERTREDDKPNTNGDGVEAQDEQSKAGSSSKSLQEFLDVMKGVDPSAPVGESSTAAKAKDVGKGKQRDPTPEVAPIDGIAEDDDDAAWLAKRKGNLEGVAEGEGAPVGEVSHVICSAQGAHNNTSLPPSKLTFKDASRPRRISCPINRPPLPPESRIHNLSTRSRNSPLFIRRNRRSPPAHIQIRRTPRYGLRPISRTSPCPRCLESVG